MSSPGSRTAETGAWLSDECPSRLPLTLFGSESRRPCLTEFSRNPDDHLICSTTAPKNVPTPELIKTTPQCQTSL